MPIALLSGRRAAGGGRGGQRFGIPDFGFGNPADYVALDDQRVEFPVIAVARDDRQPDGKIPVPVFGVESHFDGPFAARLYRLAAEFGARAAALGMHVEQRHLLVGDVRVFEAQLYRSVRFGYLSQILHRLFEAQQARIGGRSHLRSQYCRDESHRLEDAHGFPVF